MSGLQGVAFRLFIVLFLVVVTPIALLGAVMASLQETITDRFRVAAKLGLRRNPKAAEEHIDVLAPASSQH